jgi:hypothetical protein
MEAVHYCHINYFCVAVAKYLREQLKGGILCLTQNFEEFGSWSLSFLGQ